MKIPLPFALAAASLFLAASAVRANPDPILKFNFDDPFEETIKSEVGPETLKVEARNNIHIAEAYVDDTSSGQGLALRFFVRPGGGRVWLEGGSEYASLFQKSALTVTLWLKLEASEGPPRPIIHQADSSNSNGWWLSIDKEGCLTFGSHGGPDSKRIYKTLSQPLPTGEWIFVAFSYALNGSTQDSEAFLAVGADVTQFAFPAFNDLRDLPPPEKLLIGFNGGTMHARGLVIDNLQIFDKALPDLDLEALAASPK